MYSRCSVASSLFDRCSILALRFCVTPHTPLPLLATDILSKVFVRVEAAEQRAGELMDVARHGPTTVVVVVVVPHRYWMRGGGLGVRSKATSPDQHVIVFRFSPPMDRSVFPIL